MSSRSLIDIERDFREQGFETEFSEDGSLRVSGWGPYPPPPPAVDPYPPAPREVSASPVFTAMASAILSAAAGFLMFITAPGSNPDRWPYYVLLVLAGLVIGFGSAALARALARRYYGREQRRRERLLHPEK